MEGIFRLSGFQDEVRHIKSLYDQGSFYTFSDDLRSSVGKPTNLSKVTDPHVVAGVLKQYFRQLPGSESLYLLTHSMTETVEAILTWELYECFIAAIGTSLDTPV